MVYNSFLVPVRTAQYDEQGRLSRTWLDFLGGVARKAGRSALWRGVYDGDLEYAVCDVVALEPPAAPPNKPVRVSLWIALQPQPIQGRGPVTPGTDDTVWELILEVHGIPAGGDDGQVLAKASDADYDVEWVDETGGGGTVSTAGVVGVCIDGGGSTPGTGSKGYLQVPYAATINGWTMLADVSGSAQITVKKSTYAAFPATASIVASLPPKLTSQRKNTSTTLTGWTTAIAAGDVLEFNLDSASTVQRVILELQVTKL